MWLQYSCCGDDVHWSLECCQKGSDDGEEGDGCVVIENGGDAKTRLFVMLLDDHGMEASL